MPALDLCISKDYYKHDPHYKKANYKCYLFADQQPYKPAQNLIIYEDKTEDIT